MTEFVLEILDGDRAGEIFELKSDPITLGRRAGNDIVLNDEKCSGRHAMVVLEDGQWVLRDQESTNGTLLDGRRVDEVGLTANDIFQVGVTRIGFKEKGAPTPRNELSVRKVDAATLKRTRRGGGVGVLLALVLLLGGGAVWYFKFRGDDPAGPSLGPRRVTQPLKVAGDQLPGGDFEKEEELFKSVSGADFALDSGGAHTGRSYLVAGRTGEAGSRHGLARSKAVEVSSGGAVAVRAFVLTAGQARAAVRVRFTSSRPELPQLLFTGTEPARYEDYTEVALDLPVPAGCDRAEVELLALLPDGEARVQVDDVSLVANPTSPVTSKLQTSVGQRVTWTGGAVQIDDGQSMVLLGLRAATTDPDLAGLAKEGLLGLSDLGMQLAVQDAEGAIALQTSGGPGGALTLRFDADVAASGVLTRMAAEPFVNQGVRFQLASVDSLVLGYGTTRFLVALPQPVAVTGTSDDRTFELTLPGGQALRLVYDFRKERDAAADLYRQAGDLLKEAKYSEVLDRLATVIGTYPHDASIAAKAVAMRTGIREELSEKIRHYATQLDEATYFGSLRGYRRIQTRLARLVAEYGEGHVVEIDKVRAMQARLTQQITEVEREVGREARGKLEVLARIYGDSHPEVGSLIQNYIAAHLPADESDPAPAAAKKNSGSGSDPDKENQ